jgi:DNA-binding transcriptional ArsR family regulator
MPADTINGTLAALADETRKSVIDLLSREPRRASEIAAALGLTPQAMSRHLRILRRSGLIREKGVAADARVRIYHLRQEPFQNLRHWLDQVESYWVEELSAFRDHVKKRTKNAPR